MLPGLQIDVFKQRNVCLLDSIDIITMIDWLIVV